MAGGMYPWWYQNVGRRLGSDGTGAAPRIFHGVGGPFVGSAVQGAIGAAAGYGVGALGDFLWGKDPDDPGYRRRKSAIIGAGIAAAPNLPGVLSSVLVGGRVREPGEAPLVAEGGDPETVKIGSAGSGSVVALDRNQPWAQPVRHRVSEIDKFIFSPRPRNLGVSPEQLRGMRADPGRGASAESWSRGESLRQFRAKKMVTPPGELPYLRKSLQFREAIRKGGNDIEMKGKAEKFPNLAGGRSSGSVKTASAMIIPFSAQRAMSEIANDPYLDPFAKARIQSSLDRSMENQPGPFTSGLAMAATSAAGAYALPRVMAAIFGGLTPDTRDTLRQVGLLAPLLSAAVRNGVPL